MIKDHQDLLNKYYSAERSLIAEFSYDFDKSYEELDKLVDEYTARMGLESPKREH